VLRQTVRNSNSALTSQAGCRARATDAFKGRSAVEGRQGIRVRRLARKSDRHDRRRGCSRRQKTQGSRRRYPTNAGSSPTAALCGAGSSGTQLLYNSPTSPDSHSREESTRPHPPLPRDISPTSSPARRAHMSTADHRRPARGSRPPQISTATASTTRLARSASATSRVVVHDRHMSAARRSRGGRSVPAGRRVRAPPLATSRRWSDSA
jgi:hypothetical protein